MALATPGDLASYLQQQDVDLATATLLLDLAESAVLAVLAVDTMPTPAPVNGKAVVLSAAARAYTNPAALQQEAVGPFSRIFGGSGVTLTREERRLIIGGAGVLSVPLESERDGERADWWTSTA
jgi:fructose-specific component phosphotransferase system IIB-like protein